MLGALGGLVMWDVGGSGIIGILNMKGPGTDGVYPKPEP